MSDSNSHVPDSDDDDIDTSNLGDPITDAEVDESPLLRKPKANLPGNLPASISRLIPRDSTLGKILARRDPHYVPTLKELKQLREDLEPNASFPDPLLDELLAWEASGHNPTDAQIAKFLQRLGEESDIVELPPPSMASRNRPVISWSEGARRRPGVEEPVLDLPLGQLRAGAFPRIHLGDDDAELVRLTNSMLVYGQIGVLLVVRHATIPDCYFVINGHRCLQAARNLGWPTIKCLVRSIEKGTEALILHMLENSLRKTPTSYETAVFCELLARRGVKPRDIAKLLGYSPTYIYNMLKCLHLPTNILADWQHQHPALTIANVIALAYSPDSAAAWERLRAKYERAMNPVAGVPPSDGHADDLPGWEPYQRPSKVAALKVRDVLSRADMPCTPEEVRELALGLVDYFRGVRPNVPHIRIPQLKKRLLRRRSSDDPVGSSGI